MTALDDPPSSVAAEPPGSPHSPGRWWSLLVTRPGAIPERDAWLGALLKAALAYAVSRVIVVFGAAVAAASRVPRPDSALQPIVDVLTSWDGLWYIELVLKGYPTEVIAEVTYFDTEARAAFFPLYPLLVRATDVVLPGGEVTAALAVNLVLGAAFVWLVGLLTRRLAGPRAAGRAMVLTALFPGSFVLSFAYSEAILLTLAAACLLMLVERRWLWAGLLAGLATASRPNAVALAVACGLAALVAVWREREWKALVAPLLAPVGFLAFHTYLWAHTGELGVWFRVQREAWNEGTSYGTTAVTRSIDFLLHPFGSATNAITAMSLVALVAGVYCVWRARLPLPLWSYSAVVLVLMLLPATVTARPRFLYTAFPLLIAVAMVWKEDHDDGWAMLLAACGAGLAILTALYGVQAAIP
jgi:hypothetical protein